MMGQEKIGIMLSQPLTRSLFEEVSGFSGWIVVRCENNPFSSTNVEYILSEISKNKNNQFSITRWEGDSISFIFDENYMAISYQIDSDHYWQAKSRSIFLGKSRYSFCCGYCRRWHYFNRSQTIPRKKGFEIISDILIHGELSAKWHGENRSRSQDFAEEKARLMASSR